MRRPATVGFRDLRVRCIIGVLPHEREQPQDVILTVLVETDITQAAASDDVACAIDYAAIAAHARDTAVQGRYQLLERLVDVLAETILRRWPGADSVFVEARKPAAIAGAAAAVVSVTRRRSPAP